ncbi:Ultraviolet-B receptor UVR8-like [Oopsacas minuta]|uniref:Ultraviolet-B receptor UVR8-like n=1 Tax=Oopsacas minuta TaxID=111878 RepID=A0AAV7K9B0_9METZ|nr:Ultraviolet-B receptor UVR8-like [Oopsacas minuta]
MAQSISKEFDYVKEDVKYPYHYKNDSMGHNPILSERLLEPNHHVNKPRRRKKRTGRSVHNAHTPHLDIIEATDKKDVLQQSLFISLPLEILLKISSEYSLSARDLINLSLSCKYFSASILNGRCIAEEAAKLGLYYLLSNSIPMALERIRIEGMDQLLNECLTPNSNETWLQVYDAVHKLYTQKYVDKGTMCCAGGSHTGIVTEGELYTFGLGNNGQLGLGSYNDVLIPTQVNIQPYGRDFMRRGLRVDRVKARYISCGLLYSALVSDRGVLYTCGKNTRGELGYPALRDEGEQDDQGYFPYFFVGVLLPESISVKTVECGDHHTAIITDTGLLYTFGGNEHGQLGLGDFSNRREPALVETLRAFICTQVSAFTHTAVVTVCGALFTFGEGERGQLGSCDAKTCPVPNRVNCLKRKRVIHVAAGYSHMLVVTSRGELYSCGWNAHYRLGIRELAPSSIAVEPTKVLFPGVVRIRKVWAGMSHSLALSEGGELYGWGRNLNGEVGVMGLETEYQITPKCILSVKEPVVQASGGLSHTLAVTADGGVYSWGSGAKGRLGHGTTHNKIYPGLIKV